MDSIQNDLDANFPQLEIDIIGVNPISHESGNALASDGRDIPWLQDVDANNDGQSDVWLNTDVFPFAYRDVVILDANNVVVEAYNLTTNDLAEGENYSELTDKLVAAASTDQLEDDSAVAMADHSIDVPVLENDPDSSSLQLVSVTTPSEGTTQIVAGSMAADLGTRSNSPDLVISEVSPGNFIELFNHTYETIDLSNVDSVLVSGNNSASVASLSSASVGPRDYISLPWPGSFSATAATGEMALYGNALAGFETPANLLDYVVWGSGGANSHLSFAQQAGKWSGDPASTLSSGSIHRTANNDGIVATHYNVSAGPSEAAAIGNVTESYQVIRYTPPQAFEGKVTFTYTAEDNHNNERTADVTVDVSASAKPWQNTTSRLDVNTDGHVVLQDALIVINALNRGLGGPLPVNPTAPFLWPYLDSNGSNSLELLDALLIINDLNSPEGEGEGEAENDSISQTIATIAATTTEPTAKSSSNIEPFTGFTHINDYFATLGEDDDELTFI